jgi:hypothetical protein
VSSGITKFASANAIAAPIRLETVSVRVSRTRVRSCSARSLGADPGASQEAGFQLPLRVAVAMGRA